ARQNGGGSSDGEVECPSSLPGVLIDAMNDELDFVVEPFLPLGRVARGLDRVKTAIAGDGLAVRRLASPMPLAGRPPTDGLGRPDVNRVSHAAPPESGIFDGRDSMRHRGAIPSRPVAKC